MPLHAANITGPASKPGQFPLLWTRATVPQESPCGRNAPSDGGRGTVYFNLIPARASSSAASIQAHTQPAPTQQHTTLPGRPGAPPSALCSASTVQFRSLPLLPQRAQQAGQAYTLSLPITRHPSEQATDPSGSRGPLATRQTIPPCLPRVQLTHHLFSHLSSRPTRFLRAPPRTASSTASSTAAPSCARSRRSTG